MIVFALVPTVLVQENQTNVVANPGQILMKLAFLTSFNSADKTAPQKTHIRQTHINEILSIATRLAYKLFGPNEYINNALLDDCNREMWAITVHCRSKINEHHNLRMLCAISH